MGVKKWVGGALVITLATFSIGFPRGAKGGTEEAISYLEAKPANAWVTMALAAAGRNPSVEYLKNATGTNALALEAPILALAAVGKDPRTFPNTNLVSALKNFATSEQIGDPTLVNDDIFGILALVAAGEPVSDPTIQDAKVFIVSKQKENGSWSYGTSGSEDTNTTAAGIMALIGVGVSKTAPAIQNALTYLRSTQNNDGGFPYDPQSPYGTSSDASSDAWVVSALHAAGEDINTWEKNGTTPLEHLSSLQKTEGYFVNQEGGGETSFTPTETAYALIALLGKWYPITRASLDAPFVEYKFEGADGVLCEGEIGAWDALELVKNAAGVCNFTYEIVETSYGPYLKSINEDVAEGMKGWLYAVNMIMPSIGAADYTLQDGDEVFWQFGEEMTLGEKTQMTIPLEITIDGDGGGSGGGGGGGGGSIPEVSFVIVEEDGRAPSFRFGSAKTGDTFEKTITLSNNGQKTLRVESVVTGDALFRENLKVDGQGWRTFETELASSEEKDANVEVRIPTSYTEQGKKSGTLTFWGVAQ